MALQIIADQYTLHETSRLLARNRRLDPSSRCAAPAYEPASSKDLEPLIPQPGIFKSLAYTANQNHNLPSTAECAVHLEFLAVLHALHQRVLESTELDLLFVIDSSSGSSFAVRKLWRAKWDKYVELASVRFLAWWTKIHKVFTSSDGGIPKVTEETLPPLDVLMVWHSFLLNPDWFRASCTNGTQLLYEIDFPWAQINLRINPDDWSLTLPPSACATFHAMTGLTPDLLATMLEWKSYNANICRQVIEHARISLQPAELLLIREDLREPEQALLDQITNAHTPSAERLKAASLRHDPFVHKMWDQRWIRSPGLEYTIRRARERYSNFLELFKRYPATLLIPALDIDLIWLTHVCSPLTYYNITRDVAGRFLGYNDSIEQSKLTAGLIETSKLYRIDYAKEYHVCGCWNCQYLLSVIEDAGENPDWKSIAKVVSSDVAYYKAVEVAREGKKPLPLRPANLGTEGPV